MKHKVIEDGIEYDLHEDEYGDKRWYINNKLHRETGPAYEGTRYKAWCKHGFRHREDGPAIIFADGSVIEYWLNGIPYPDVNSPEELLLASIIL